MDSIAPLNYERYAVLINPYPVPAAPADTLPQATREIEPAGSVNALADRYDQQPAHENPAHPMKARAKRTKPTPPLDASMGLSLLTSEMENALFTAKMSNPDLQSLDQVGSFQRRTLYVSSGAENNKPTLDRVA